MQLSTETSPGRTTTAVRLQEGKFHLRKREERSPFRALSILGLTHLSTAARGRQENYSPHHGDGRGSERQSSRFFSRGSEAELPWACYREAFA